MLMAGFELSTRNWLKEAINIKYGCSCLPRSMNIWWKAQKFAIEQENQFDRNLFRIENLILKNREVYKMWWKGILKELSRNNASACDFDDGYEIEIMPIKWYLQEQRHPIASSTADR